MVFRCFPRRRGLGSSRRHYTRETLTSQNACLQVCPMDRSGGALVLFAAKLVQRDPKHVGHRLQSMHARRGDAPLVSRHAHRRYADLPGELVLGEPKAQSLGSNLLGHVHECILATNY
jgi:hypothetical protein